MNVTRFLLLVLLLTGCRKATDSRALAPPPEEMLTFAFYNVENLFDTADDPANPGDDDFTPDGKMRWTEERLDRKMAALARAIRTIGDGGPDLIGLCEVENRGVLERLVGEYLPRGVYDIVHADSPDERGIDVALLYRRSSMSLAGFRPHRVNLDAWDDRTRDIIEASFMRDGVRFTVLVNHWPSRSGGAEASEPRRLEAARTAARIIDSLYALDSRADIVMMGDLNDEPANASLHDILDARGLADGGHRLINTTAALAAADTLGSYFYRGDWETIDQILVSRGVLDSVGIVLYEPAETIEALEFLRDQKADPVHRPPYRTFKNGNHYIGGTSDHFPVSLTVGWVKK